MNDLKAYDILVSRSVDALREANVQPRGYSMESLWRQQARAILIEVSEAIQTLPTTIQEATVSGVPIRSELIRRADVLRLLGDLDG